MFSLFDQQLQGSVWGGRGGGGGGGGWRAWKVPIPRSDGSVNIGSRGWVTGMVVNYRWERVCIWSTSYNWTPAALGPCYYRGKNKLIL